MLSRLRDEDDEVRLAAVGCLAELLDDRVREREGAVVGDAVAAELRREGQRAAMQARCLIVLSACNTMRLNRIAHRCWTIC